MSVASHLTQVDIIFPSSADLFHFALGIVIAGNNVCSRWTHCHFKVWFWKNFAWHVDTNIPHPI